VGRIPESPGDGRVLTQTLQAARNLAFPDFLSSLVSRAAIDSTMTWALAREKTLVYYWGLEPWSFVRLFLARLELVP
jgi:hypothetical protein